MYLEKLGMLSQKVVQPQEIPSHTSE